MTTLQIRKQTAPILKGLSILLYGMAKVGKTTNAAKFPEPLFLNCEPGGTNFLSGDLDLVDVNGLDHLDSLLPAIKKTPHKTIVLDGFTWLINYEVKTRGKGKDTSARRRIYAEVTDQMGRILGELCTFEKIIIATGHSRIVTMPDTTAAMNPSNGKAEDIEEIRPDINPSLAGGVLGLFSIICYCFADSGGPKMITKPVRVGKYRILAGDRSGALDQTMPLDAKLMMDKLRGLATVTASVK